MANGALVFGKLVVKGESSYGAGAAADFATGGRRMNVTPTGVVSLGREYDTGADRTIGNRNPLIASRVVQLSENPEVTIDAPAITTDDLAVWLSSIQKTNAGGTPTGTAAPYTWAYPIGLSVGSAIAPKSLEAIVLDNNQGYHISGILPTSVSLSADASGVTSLSVSAFAEAVTKTSQATADALDVTGRSMPGRLWSASYGTAFLTAGTTGGTAFTHLMDWSLEFQTGMAPINAQAGTITAVDYNQFAGPVGGTLSLTVASNDIAVAQLFDKLGTKSYWRLHWEDAGSPAHSVDILVCAVPTSVEIMSGDADGLITYSAELMLATDDNGTASVTFQVKNSLSVLP
jgi:hypothetical protein